MTIHHTERGGRHVIMAWAPFTGDYDLRHALLAELSCEAQRESLKLGQRETNCAMGLMQVHARVLVGEFPYG